MLRAVAENRENTSLEDVRLICGIPGFIINSASLQGGLGETAQHVAAAAGNLKVLRALLDFRADPNAQDHIREVPLHYAALTGQVESAQLLLSYGAIASAESAFSETPLVVAAAPPAEFLGVSTTRVHAILGAWEAGARTGDW